MKEDQAKLCVNCDRPNKRKSRFCSKACEMEYADKGGDLGPLSDAIQNFKR